MSTIKKGKFLRFLSQFSASFFQEFVYGIHCGKIDFKTLRTKEIEHSDTEITAAHKNKILLKEFGTMEEYFQQPKGLKN